MEAVIISLGPLLIPIVAIVGGIAAGMFSQWLKFKRRQLEITSEQVAEKAAQYAAKTECVGR